MTELRGLRVLMQIRPDFAEKPGGDVVQLVELLPFLRGAGLTVELTGETRPDLADWDLVHTINLDRPEEPYAHCLNAQDQGRPVVLSTVHTDLSEFRTWSDTAYWLLPDPNEGPPEPRPAPPPAPVQEHAEALRHLQRQAIIDWSTGYLPNAHSNLDYLQRTFGLDLDRTTLVPNGVREPFFSATPDLFVERYGLRDFVLSVGRLESKKNQLSLLAALRGSGIPLVIVGRPNPPAYAELCRRYADENVHFLEHLEEAELVSACAAAKVHALVSWVELPGLTTLEAGGGLQYRLHGSRLPARVSARHGLVLQPAGCQFHPRGRPRRLSGARAQTACGGICARTIPGGTQPNRPWRDIARPWRFTRRGPPRRA